MADVAVTITLYGFLKTVVAPLAAIGVGLLVGGGGTLLFVKGKGGSTRGGAAAVGSVVVAGAAAGVLTSLGFCVYLYGWATLGVPVVLGLVWRGVLFVVNGH